MRTLKSVLLVSFALAAISGHPLGAQEPLSAIDWLNDPPPISLADPLEVALPEPNEGVSVPEIAVQPLTEPQGGTVGLLSGATTGLPAELWSTSQAQTLAALFARISSDPLPALQALYYTLLLTEAEAPQDSQPNADARFLIARVETLRRMGAVEPALALIEVGNPVRPALFDAWFDLSLLTGDEATPCKALTLQPSLSQSFENRIYCAARNGDWQTAALTFETANALDLLDRNAAPLLAQFLDPETIHQAPNVPQGRSVSPLIFRLLEAAGQPQPTRNLPRAFAVADLRGVSGWKAELEAAERLTNTGALPANQLLGLYTAQRAAASGGVWDRVSAVQALESALASSDADRVTRVLTSLWPAMRREGLAVAFATLYGSALSELELRGPARQMAYRIALLSPDYEALATQATPDGPRAQFLQGLARGAPDPELARSTAERAIADAFASTTVSDDHTGLLKAGRLGQAILTSALQLDAAGPNQGLDITAGLSTLRAVGLEDTARRAALQILLLKSRS